MELLSIGENSSDGCILKFDLEYPDEFHDFHNDYLLAPEKLEIRNDMLSKHNWEKKALLIVLKKNFLSWWLIVFMVKQWKF